MIERAEVMSGDMQNLKWERVPADREFMNQWTQPMLDPVDPMYLTDMFVTPLGPRVGMEWEDYVGHPPEIPMLADAQTLGGGMQDEDMIGRPRGFGGRPMGGRMGGGLGRPMGPRGLGAPIPGARPGGVAPPAAAPPGAAAETPFGAGPDGFQRGVRQEEVQEEYQDPAELLRMNEVVAKTRAGEEEREIKGVDHLLFRFCDFSVQPGKQYVYRVKLGLGNPNLGILVRHLKSPELADGMYKTTDWSEPSPIVFVPFGDKILAGPFSPATASKEPTAKVRIVQIKKEVGVEVPMEEAEVLRGRVLNFVNKTTEYIDPRPTTVESLTTNFSTNATLVDMRGGNSTLQRDKSVTEPGELLVLDRKGQLIALHEFDDEETWKNYAVPIEEEQAVGRGDEMMEEEDLLRPRGRRRGRSTPPPVDPLGSPKKPARAARMPAR